MPDDDEPRRESSGSRHGPIAQLLMAWSPLRVILIIYALAGWTSAPLEGSDGAATNRLGFAVHVAGPTEADRGLFGVLPSVWLQERLLGGSAHWYDAVAALVYVTHFVSVPLVSAACGSAGETASGHGSPLCWSSPRSA